MWKHPSQKTSSLPQFDKFFNKKGEFATEYSLFRKLCHLFSICLQKKFTDQVVSRTDVQWKTFVRCTMFQVFLLWYCVEFAASILGLCIRKGVGTWVPARYWNISICLLYPLIEPQLDLLMNHRQVSNLFFSWFFRLSYCCYVCLMLQV
jgi:hypothetical protein